MDKDGSLATGAYGLHRGRTWISIGVSLFAASAFLLFALIATDAWRVICLVIGVLLVVAAIAGVRMLTDRRPMLVLSAEGLFYRSFADVAAPWAEITALAFVLGFNRSVAWGRVKWKREPRSDQICFAVADPARYPSGVGRSFFRALQRLSGTPPIVIQLWYVDADPDGIRAEIAKYWPGQITTIERRLRDAGDQGP